MPTEPGEYVVLHNDGDTDHRYRYQSKWYTIPAHGKQIVPWGHFAHVCGDPFVQNADRNKDRDREWERLRTLYGRDKAIDEWPALRAEDADGQPLYGIMQDRYGERAPAGAAPTDAMDPVALKAQLEAMQRRQAALEQLLSVAVKSGDQTPAPADTPPAVKPDPTTPPVIDDIIEDPDSPPSDIPEDKPNRPPVKKAAARK